MEHLKLMAGLVAVAVFGLPACEKTEAPASQNAFFLPSGGGNPPSPFLTNTPTSPGPVPIPYPNIGSKTSEGDSKGGDKTTNKPPDGPITENPDAG